MEKDSFRERAPRLPLDVQVNSSHFGFAQSKNISTTGIALLTEKPLKAGDFLQLVFYLPESSREISAYGKVVWASEVSESYFESGIQFWEIEEEDQLAIERYFSSH